MKDGQIHVLRALSLGLCLRRIAILLLLAQQQMGIMTLSRATGNYRQLVTADLLALLNKKLISKADKRGRVTFYETSPYGDKVLELLNVPLELTPVVAPNEAQKTEEEEYRLCSR